MQDRKLLVESESILKSAIDIIKAENPAFLLVAGDLTKDGERINHEMLADYLAKLKTAGIPSFVVPGNHDIANPHAMSFSGDIATPVASVTPEEFVQIYNDFGFSSAIYRDDSSLSYIAEPSEGIWLFAIDGCRYKENTTSPITGGKLSETTLEWIKENLIKAKNENKIPVGMIHHGILEHYTGQKLFFPDYVIDDYINISKLFAQYGMKIVFTGHYHAQDITYKSYSADEMPDGNAAEIYDIETGSLVTNPNSVRTITLSSDLSLDIKTTGVTEIDFPTDTLTFPEYSESYLAAGLSVLVPYLLTLPAEEGGYGLPAETAQTVTPYFVQAFAAHYKGDEAPSAETINFITYLNSSGDPNMLLLGSALGTLWTDLNPSDNAYTIGNISAVVDENIQLPLSSELYQNYPNPFNPATTIKYSIAEQGLVSLKLFDILGREISTLINEEKPAGEYSIVYNASALASGVYFCRLQVNDFTSSKKLILMK
jgi:DNA repair exonuclease SbcCD nuclease subunit